MTYYAAYIMDTSQLSAHRSQESDKEWIPAGFETPGERCAYPPRPTVSTRIPAHSRIILRGALATQCPLPILWSQISGDFGGQIA